MATTTAAQRREQAKRDYDAFLEECPTHGHELFPVMLAIKSWAESHMDRVFEARAQFDARP